MIVSVEWLGIVGLSLVKTQMQEEEERSEKRSGLNFFFGNHCFGKTPFYKD